MGTTSPVNIENSSKKLDAFKVSEICDNEQALFSGSANQNAETLQAGLGIEQKNFELMDSPYKAAVEGHIDQFKAHADSLDQILTPNENTILHIHITARPQTKNYNRFWKIGLKRKSEERIPRENFVREILKMCPDLLLKVNTKGETLPHMAARHGHADIVKDLIAECKMPHQNDAEKDVEVARLMLGMTNKAKDTALHEAVRYNQVDVVKILTKEDPNLSYDSNNAGETPLYLAAERGYKDVMKEIMLTCKSPADHGPMGRTALHAAVFCGDEEITKMLLDFKGTLTSKPDQQGWLPLHLAAHLGCYHVLKELIKADKSAAYKVDNEGKIALHIAADRGNVYSMQELILSCPSCCELADNKGRNVFHFAVNSECRKAVQFILNNRSLGNLVNEKNDEGNTPLLEHAASGSYMKSFICHPKVDKLSFNNQNHNATDTIVLDKFLFSPRESSFLQRLRRLNGNRGQRQIVAGGAEMKGNIVGKKSDYRKERKASRDKVLVEYMKEGKDAHLVVAALIATVTFTACITMAGGYINEKEPDKATAVLTRSRAFQAFVVTNSIAMVLSSTSVFIHLFVPLIPDKKEGFAIWELGLVLIVYAMLAMVLAFISGTYAVLYSAKELAVVACVVAVLFLSIYMWFEPLEGVLRLVRKLVHLILPILKSEFSGIYFRIRRRIYPGKI